MPTGQKHLVRCRCILPQYKNQKDPPVHQFVVFSVIEDDGSVRAKFVQCNNCGIVHKVVDVCKSEIIHNRDTMPAAATIEDLKNSIPERLVAVLESHDADLPTWEAVSFIIENQDWGNYVVLTTDSIDGLRQGKYVRILGHGLFKVETYVRNEVI